MFIMLPISAMDAPDAAAASAVKLRYRVNSLPGLTPAATAEAAVVAASSRPYAVPLTEALAFFIISFTCSALLPRPVSFAFASSIAFRRVNPLDSAIPASAVVAAKAGAVTNFESLPPIDCAALPMPPKRVCRLLQVCCALLTAFSKLLASPVILTLSVADADILSASFAY